MATQPCPGCAQRDAQIKELEQRIQRLEKQLQDLQLRLHTNSTNSSIPPSANPPHAPKPIPKKPSRKKRGAQKGHPPHLRQRLPQERLKKVIDFVPSHCQDCHQPLPAQSHADDPPPSWHQVAELPKAAAEITEYRGHYRTCRCCGKVNHQAIPSGLKENCIGPRLAALLCYLSGSHRLSKRSLEEFVEDVLEVPLALGTIKRLEEQMSQALAAPYQDLVRSVAQAEVKHVDETGWKQAGKRCWLWVAATSMAAVFLIHARRSWQALKALLGEGISGLICSDRWHSYNHLPPWRRQICWAHLKRDFQKLVDRGGAGKRIGQGALELTTIVFEQWHLFRGGTLSRQELMSQMIPLEQMLRGVLEAGVDCACGKTATFCENVLLLWPAVWRFVWSEGVEPTNNHAERVLRRGVLWRKNAFGCQSEQGCRFVERMLTVVQTRRLQGKSVFAYLHQALTAYRQGRSAPSLIDIG